ncbi:STP1 protein [Plasmodium ovale]|uniref:STP1 protein n=1 Tax=Plasmodium ovale TaxID=36330 RepID=A0A1C3KKF1_PLAOA|nr:STP1 protein [Plasmodium ovale]
MMKKFTHNCNDIKRHSKKETNNIFIRYKTPILEGAIKIINEFKKDKDDGVHYKNLCEELNKYVKIQKRCAKEEIESQGHKFKTYEWNKIVDALYTTFNSQKIKRLCYLEKDKEETTKKYVLNIHEVFRNFCIEKKPKETNSTLPFEECMDYLQWEKMKKDMILGLDPGYSYIRDYSEYFNIRNKCNYPWLISNTPDVICTQSTKTKPKDKDSEKKSSGDTDKTPPDVTQVSTVDEKKDTPPAAQHPGKADEGLDKVKTSDTSPGNALTKTAVPDYVNRDNNIAKINPLDITLVTTSYPEPTPVFQLTPKNYYHDNEAQIKSYRNFLEIHLDGQKIPEDIHHSINSKDQNIPKYFPTYVQGEPFIPTLIEPYNIIPLQIPQSHSFSDSVPPVPKYTPPRTSYKIPAAFFPPLLPPITKITSGTKEIKTVLIQPATPDASYFRSPFMIYTLIFLTIVAIITIFYLLSKYTPFGLLFGKKRKKQRLKRHLKTNKLPEEVPQVDTKDIYSINNMAYKNKTHYNKDTNSHIIIKKGIINKNISLPKRKKKKGKAIIDIHMEMLNECKNDEWELNKNDLLEICLEQFIIEQNNIYSNSKNSNLITKIISTKNAKEPKILLWDKWAETFTPIWKNFKRGNTFKILQYKWKKEENSYFDKIEEQNSSLNENEKFSYIEIKKDIWRRWISKQTKLIEQYKEEQWFKSLVEELENVSDEYKKGKIKDDIFVENVKELENKENNEELYKHGKHIFQIKVLIQILMMVIEQCIKEENPEQSEVLLDNLINKLNKEKRAKIEPENIYEEKMNHIQYNEMLE